MRERNEPDLQKEKEGGIFHVAAEPLGQVDGLVRSLSMVTCMKVEWEEIVSGTLLVHAPSLRFTRSLLQMGRAY